MRLYKPESQWFAKRANITAVVMFTWIVALFASVLKYSNDFFYYCERKKDIVRNLTSEVGKFFQKLTNKTKNKQTFEHFSLNSYSFDVLRHSIIHSFSCAHSDHSKRKKAPEKAKL
jgi:hypothetical protein